MSKLEEMLKYVSEHNAFYKNIIKEYNVTDPTDITQWPIIRFLDGFNHINDDIVELHQKTIYSSGSTGKTKRVLWSKFDYNRMCCNAWRLRHIWYNVSPIMKTLCFYSTPYYDNTVDFDNENKDYYYSSNTLLINYTFFYNRTDEAIAVIRSFSPEIVIAFPSVVKLLADTADCTLAEKIRYIEIFGESAQEEQREFISRVFRNAKIVNMYGASEVGVISLECPCGKMHIIHDNCYIETGEKNNLIITSLTNTLSPFIRYDIGDFGAIRKAECTCGYNDLIIDSLLGKKSEYIILSDNTKISSLVLTEVISKICVEFENSILSFYAEQREKGVLELYISISERFSLWVKTIINALNKDIRRITGKRLKLIVKHAYPDYVKKQNYFRSFL